MNQIGVVFETDRLWVRPWQEDDVDGWHDIIGDAEVMKYVGTGKTSPNIHETSRKLEAFVSDCAAMPPGLGWWAAIEKSTGNIVGSVNLSPEIGAPQEIMLGYHLHRSAWGKGYATELASAAIRYGANVLGLTKIMSKVEPENVASIRVLEKVGLRPAGVFEREGKTWPRFEITVVPSPDAKKNLVSEEGRRAT